MTSIAALLAAVAVVALVAAGCGSGSTRAQHERPARIGSVFAFPNTPAGRQARWLARGVEHLPIPAAQIRAHFDRAFLAHIPAPAIASLNGGFAGLTRLGLDSVTSSNPDAIVFAVTLNGTAKASVSLVVDGKGLIGGLHVAQAPPPSASATGSKSSTSVSAGIRQVPVGIGSPPLKGTLTLPAGKGRFPAVVLVSGSGPNDQNETVGPNKPFEEIALGLASRGIASVRYDKRTRDYPRSVNPRTFTPTREYVPDALTAIRLLAREPGVNPRRIFVLGHSLGGTYAPLIAQHAPAVAGVILLAGGAETLGQAILRQTRFLATLPGTIGDQSRASLPDLIEQAAQIDNIATLEKDSPGKVLLGGLGPAYYLSELRYHEVATARSLPQPLLLVQGGRDYQVTISNDLDVWLQGLKGRSGVSVVRLPHADHLFIDGAGPPNPAEYAKAARLDPGLIPAIVAWIDRLPGAQRR
jgi:alpha-beta hydrolase superfamily lysophospholipase